jgi:hypothetical protein
MAPAKKPWSEEERVCGGFKSMSDFFMSPPKPGRPAGSGRAKPGPKPAASPAATLPCQTEKPPPANAPATPRTAAAPKQAGGKRENYSSGEPLERMGKAVSDWLGKAGKYLEVKPAGDMKAFCLRVEIPQETFRKYVCADESKRRNVGSGVGNSAKSKHIDEDDAQFCVDVLRRKDRGDGGMSRREGIDMLNDLRPELSRKQSENAFDRQVRAKHKDQLTGVIKAEATTWKRSAITVPQQWRWHSTVDKAFDILRTRNVGNTPDGKTFGEVMHNFIIGGDETCFLASNGDVSIIGDKEKKKHQVHAAESRTSITVYRVGSAAGKDGPTGFLPPGLRCKHGYTDKFLIENGAAVGSTIIMTPTGYMTEEAWDEMAQPMAAGIRQMDVIKDNPEWWVVKIIDGYGPHVSSVRAMEIYQQHKILLLKEEGDSSHVNQSYDQDVAKQDKRSMRGALGFLRTSSKITKGVTDGWMLIHVALAAVRELDSESWIKSFKKVNLHPHHRVSFEEWCKRIAHHLQGGLNFKPETHRDMYTMLPTFWHGMLPDEKKQAMAIAKADDMNFSVACVRELHSKVHVPLGDMQNLRVCLELAVEDPSQLDRGLPEKHAQAGTMPEAVATAAAQVSDINDGLESFMLHPKKVDGTQLYSGAAKFAHLSKLARRSVSEDKGLTTSAYLDVEVSATQQKLLNPKPVDYMMHAIAKHTHGEDAKQSMAKRKLDALGFVRASSGFANDEVRMKRLKNQLNLASSLAQINQLTAAEAATKASQNTAQLVEKAPAAVDKLKSKAGGDFEKMTMDEMKAIAFVHFKGTVLKGNKTQHITSMVMLVKDQPTILNLAPPPATAVEVVAAGPVLDAGVPTIVAEVVAVAPAALDADGAIV